MLGPGNYTFLRESLTFTHPTDVYRRVSLEWRDLMSNTQRARTLLAQIGEERAAAATVRSRGGLAVLAMFLVFAGVIYNKITHFDTEVLVTELQVNATRTIWPLVYKELDQVGKEALPALSRAVAKEVANIGPALDTRLKSEAAIFETNMGKKMRTSLDAHLARAFDGKKAELKGNLSAFAADSEAYDDMIRKLRKAGQDWGQRRLDTTFAKHVLLLQSINNTVQRLSAQAKKDGEPTESMDEVLLLVAEILNSRVNEEG
jgi:hypothetical protein